MTQQKTTAVDQLTAPSTAVPLRIELFALGTENCARVAPRSATSKRRQGTDPVARRLGVRRVDPDRATDQREHLHNGDREFPPNRGEAWTHPSITSIDRFLGADATPR
jgi:hypothetical protein